MRLVNVPGASPDMGVIADLFNLVLNRYYGWYEKCVGASPIRSSALGTGGPSGATPTWAHR